MRLFAATRALVRLRTRRRVGHVPLVRLRLLGVGAVGRAAARRPTRRRAARPAALAAGLRPAAGRASGVTVLSQTPSAFYQFDPRPTAQPEPAADCTCAASSSAARRWTCAPARLGRRHGPTATPTGQHVRHHRDHRARHLPPRQPTTAPRPQRHRPGHPRPTPVRARQRPAPGAGRRARRDVRRRRRPGPRLPRTGPG